MGAQGRRRGRKGGGERGREGGREERREGRKGDARLGLEGRRTSWSSGSDDAVDFLCLGASQSWRVTQSTHLAWFKSHELKVTARVFLDKQDGLRV